MGKLKFDQKRDILKHAQNVYFKLLFNINRTLTYRIDKCIYAYTYVRSTFNMVNTYLVFITKYYKFHYKFEKLKMIK